MHVNTTTGNSLNILGDLPNSPKRWGNHVGEIPLERLPPDVFELPWMFVQPRGAKIKRMVSQAVPIPGRRQDPQDVGRRYCVFTLELLAHRPARARIAQQRCPVTVSRWSDARMACNCELELHPNWEDDGRMAEPTPNASLRPLMIGGRAQQPC